MINPLEVLRLRELLILGVVSAAAAFWVLLSVGVLGVPAEVAGVAEEGGDGEDALPKGEEGTLVFRRALRRSMA